MTRDLLSVLCCPTCSGDLTLTVLDATPTRRVHAGALSCETCQDYYPIVGGIPRFRGTLSDASPARAEDRRAQLDFANGTQVAERTFAERTGLGPRDVGGRFVVDVGCGGGRFVDVVSTWGARVVGVEPTEAADDAFANLGDREHVDIVQADLFHLPFRDGAFDIACSNNVLHRTRSAELGFLQLPRLVREGGLVTVWLDHATDGAARTATAIERAIVSRVPFALARAWCWLLVALLSPLYASPAAGWPLVASLSRLVPVSVHPDHDARVLDTLDWWTAPYDDGHCAPAHVSEWCEQAGLRDIEVRDTATAVCARRDDARRYPARRAPRADATTAGWTEAA